MDVLEIIKEAFEKRRTRNPQYSLRAFSRYLQIDPSTLSKVLSGKRPYPKNHLPTLIRVLDLSEATAWNLSHKMLNSEKSKKQNSVKKKTSIPWTKIDEDDYQLVVRDWEYYAVLSLCQIEDFESDLLWIAKRIGISQERAGEVVSRLLSVGLLRESLDGAWYRDKLYLESGNVGPCEAIREAHIQETLLAKRSLELDPEHIRGFYSVTLCTNQEQVKAFKNMANRFIDKAMLNLEKGPREEVYQVQVNLVPITRPQGEHK